MEPKIKIVADLQYMCVGGRDGNGACIAHFPGPDCPYCLVQSVKRGRFKNDGTIETIEHPR